MHRCGIVVTRNSSDCYRRLSSNFEANFYGVFSDNRPELALPYFQTILNHVDLGKWRAGMRFWGTGSNSASPGFWEQDFNKMSQLSTDGSGYVKAGYKGIQLPTHFSPWKHFYFVSDWGQKNIGAFTSKAFIDYYEFTNNVTFLEHVAYPLIKLNGDFYASYMTTEGGNSYNVMHSCAMEGCGAQGPATSQRIAFSNNPPFDLAFVKRTFRSLLRYSVTLGVDEDLRAGWEEIVHNIAAYPLTKDEHGHTVFAQATLNTGPTSTVTDGFPNASKCNTLLSTTSANGARKDTSECGNARYPITFFNAMHPGEDIDLESDDGILAIARQTVNDINEMNDYSPTNGLCMAWPPSARVVQSTERLLTKFTKALNDTMMPNFIPYIENRPTGGSGCNIENAGATVAVNDLLASVHGHGANASLRILPGGWPVGQPISFQHVRVRGAFTVSASGVGTGSSYILSSPVHVESLGGNPLVFNWPFTPPPMVQELSSGSSVPTKAAGQQRYRFETKTGSAYAIRLGKGA